jgi:hypothetical protein
MAAMKQIVSGLIGLGVLLLLTGVVWANWFSGGSGFTLEKAERWNEVKNRIHNLAFVVNAPPGTIKLHKGQDIGQAKAEFEALKKESEQLEAEYSGAYESPKTTAKVLRWTGLSLAVIGVIGWYAVNQSN